MSKDSRKFSLEIIIIQIVFYSLDFTHFDFFLMISIEICQEFELMFTILF